MTDVTAQEFREAAAHAENSAHWTPIEWDRLDRAAVVASLKRYESLLLAAAEQREALDKVTDQRDQALREMERLEKAYFQQEAVIVKARQWLIDTHTFAFYRAVFDDLDAILSPPASTGGTHE